MAVNPNDFLINLTQENREIVDFLTRIIFQALPNSTEVFKNWKLKFKTVQKGVFCKIYIKRDVINLDFKNGRTFKFKRVVDIDREDIEKELKVGI